MQTLTFTQWELRDLLCNYHELRNERQFNHSLCSAIMRNRTERLFDKLRFAEFNGRKQLTPIEHPGGGL